MLGLHRLPLVMDATALAEHGIMRRFVTGNRPHQRASELHIPQINASDLGDRRGKINQADNTVTYTRIHQHRRSRLDHEGHVRQGVLEGVLTLLRNTVISRQVTVVTEREDVRVVVQPAIAQFVEHETEHVVPARHHAEIHRAHLVILGLAPALHPLSLADGVQHAGLVLERLHIGAARRECSAVDERVPRFLTAIRRMRERERAVDEERLFLLLEVNGIQECQSGIHAIPVEVFVERSFWILAPEERILEVVTLKDLGHLGLGEALPAEVHLEALDVHLVDQVGSIEEVVAVLFLAPRARDEVIAADPHDLIPGLLHGPEDIGILAMHHEMHRAVAERVGIQTGKEAASAGDAHRVLAVGVREGYTLLRHGVEIGGARRRVAQMGHRIRAHLVRDEPYDVGPIIHKRLRLLGGRPLVGISLLIEHLEEREVNGELEGDEHRLPHRGLPTTGKET